MKFHNNQNWANPISGDSQFDFKDVRHQYYCTVSVLNCRDYCFNGEQMKPCWVWGALDGAG